MSTSWDSWRNGWLHPGYRCSNHTNSSMLCTNGTSFMKIIDDKGMFRLNVQKLVRLSAYIVQLKSSSACFAQQFCSRNKYTQECLTACRYGYVYMIDLHMFVFACDACVRVSVLKFRCFHLMSMFKPSTLAIEQLRTVLCNKFCLCATLRVKSHWRENLQVQGRSDFKQLGGLRAAAWQPT